MQRTLRRMGTIVTASVSLLVLAVPLSAQNGDDRSSDGTREAGAPNPLVLEAGTTFRVELREKLSTEVTQPGDRFRARVAEPVITGRRVAVPEGTVLLGTVSSVREPASDGDRSALTLRFDYLVLDGRAQDLTATLDGVRPPDEVPGDGEKRNKIGGGAAAGALVGALLSDGAKGALLGAAAGTAAGGAVYAATTDEEVVLPEGSILELKLGEPLRLEQID